ncbi:MAG TPA: PEP/pyruvate-binding domain-containing protein, partial [Candidatus Obscuribacterales bacterium]
SQEALFAAMSQVFRSYDRASAGQYRRDRGLPEASLAVMVQQQVAGLCSGVAFSRDPFTCQGAAVVIEANWGAASRVTAGQEPPERYQVTVPDDLDEPLARRGPDGWRIPPALTLPVEGTGDIPSRLLQEVAFLARHLEQRDRGIPQNIEWSFDGDRLWLLQSRPIIPPAVRPAIPSGLLAGTAAHPPTPPVVLSGLPVCPGTAIGKIVVLKALTAPRPITATDIVVVPYLKAGEIPALAQAGGLIAETGGQLSNGAIAAREYGLPTIVLPHRGGRDRLTPAQTVRLQGTTGLVELW